MSLNETDLNDDCLDDDWSNYLHNQTTTLDTKSIVTRTNIDIPILKANEVRKIDYEFFANTQYNEPNIPISIKVSESSQKYFLNETKTISLIANSTFCSFAKFD